MAKPREHEDQETQATVGESPLRSVAEDTSDMRIVTSKRGKRTNTNERRTDATNASRVHSPLLTIDDLAAEGAPAESERRPTRRLTADLPVQDADTLAEVARETGFNKVTTLIRAIRVLAELVRAERQGGELTIKYPGGRRERLIIR
jgi:hypothetical protein